MDETYEQLAEQWRRWHPEAVPWIKEMQEKLESLHFHTGEDEFTVILMRLMAPTEWPDASHWSDSKRHLGRARDKVLRPFIEGEPVDLDDLRIAIRMFVADYNQACERIYYMKESFGSPRRYKYKKARESPIRSGDTA
jgi:hypothetical protein